MATIKVTSRRWGSTDHYDIERTPTGWNVHHISIGGECNKRGEPSLYESFRQDSISYPSGLPDLLEMLWDYAERHKLTHGQLQEHLDELAEWVNVCEQSRPSGIFDM